jgi:hypothetical protein
MFLGLRLINLPFVMFLSFDFFLDVCEAPRELGDIQARTFLSTQSRSFVRLSKQLQRIVMLFNSNSFDQRETWIKKFVVRSRTRAPAAAAARPGKSDALSDSDDEKEDEKQNAQFGSSGQESTQLSMTQQSLMLSSLEVDVLDSCFLSILGVLKELFLCDDLRRIDAQREFSRVLCKLSGCSYQKNSRRRPLAESASLFFKFFCSVATQPLPKFRHAAKWIELLETVLNFPFFPTDKSLECSETLAARASDYLARMWGTDTNLIKADDLGLVVRASVVLAEEPFEKLKQLVRSFVLLLYYASFLLFLFLGGHNN